MKNFKNTFLIIAILITAPLAGAQRPPQLPTHKPSMAQLSPDLQNEILQYVFHGTAALNIPALANTITAMGNLISAEKLIEIFKSLPTNAAAISLAKELQDLPVMQSETVKNWLKAAARFVNGQRLYDAVDSGTDLPRLERLLRNRYIDLNWAGGPPYAPIPLLHAINRNHTQAAAMLIRAGADPNIVDVNGRTPLMSAVSNKNKVIINMLLNAGAAINFQSKDYGATALESALSWPDLEIIKTLLKAAANPNLQDKWGRAVLDRSLNYYGGPSVAKLLIKYGANPNLQNNGGETPLMHAAALGYVDVVEFFLAHGADPTIRNKKGQSASDLAREHITEGTLQYEHDEHNRERYRQIVEMLDAASAARPQEEKPAERCNIM